MHGGDDSVCRRVYYRDEDAAIPVSNIHASTGGVDCYSLWPVPDLYGGDDRVARRVYHPDAVAKVVSNVHASAGRVDCYSSRPVPNRYGGD